VVNYNQGIYIARCLDAVRASPQPVQLLIVDDCSTDNSIGLIQEYIRKYGLDCTLLAKKTNDGICRCLNLALEAARAPFFSFIAADDWGDPHRFANMIHLLQAAGTGYAVAYSDARIVDMEEKPLAASYLKTYRPDLTAPPQGEVFEALLQDNFLPAMATVIRTQVLREIGGFDESLKVEDYDLWLRIAAKYHFLFDPDSVCYYRILPHSLIRRIGARKYEDWISIYLKHLKPGTPYQGLIEQKLAKCCENLYYSDSLRFVELVQLCSKQIPLPGKLKLLQVLHRSGLKGSHFKRFSNFLQGRKKGLLPN